MALTIVATVGSATANSFVTEVEQIAYMATRLNASAWTTITGSTLTETEKQALIEATRDLSAFDWKGKRTDAVQALSWPRQWAVDPDSPIQDYYDSDVLPTRLKTATEELVFQYIKQGTTDLAVVDATRGVIQETVGPITTIWEAMNRPDGLRQFSRVWREIGPLLVSGDRFSAPLVRG